MSKDVKRGGRVWKWVAGAVAALVVILGGLYVAGYFIAGNQLPANASVEGVAIGGMSPADASAKLRQELEPSFAAPMALRVADADKAQINPLDSGFTLDFDGAVRDAGGGFSWSPAHIIRAFLGGGDVPLPHEVDEAALNLALQGVAEAFATDGVDATLAFDAGQVVTTPAEPADALDIDTTRPKVVQAFDERQTSVEVALKSGDPAVTDAMVADAVDKFAGPAMSGPVTVQVRDGSFQISPQQLGGATSISFAEGTFTPHVDGARLLELTAEERKGLALSEGKDATYKMTDGQIVVVPSVDGEVVDAAALGTAVQEAATKSGAERTATVGVVPQTSRFDTAAAEKVAPNQVIGEFTTYFPHADYRNNNLGRAAGTVNGTVLMPGETFSLNDTLGPRTAANGYVEGYVINGGVLVKESGGGISQSATTLFNAAMFAGLEDVEHKPHSLYFDRYPAGREATVYYGSVDLRFRNDTEYPVYIQGFIKKSTSSSKGSITFRMWSRPTWDKIVVTDATKSGFYTGGERTLPAGTKCEPQAPIQGFTAKWSRTFYKGGQAVRTEKFTWKYSAGDRIICG